MCELSYTSLPPLPVMILPTSPVAGLMQVGYPTRWRAASACLLLVFMLYLLSCLSSAYVYLYTTGEVQMLAPSGWIISKPCLSSCSTCLSSISLRSLTRAALCSFFRSALLYAQHDDWHQGLLHFLNLACAHAWIQRCRAHCSWMKRPLS